MKLNYAPQVGLRRRRPDHRRERLAFWAGIAILIAFELILMAKSDFDELHWPWTDPSAVVSDDGASQTD